MFESAISRMIGALRACRTRSLPRIGEAPFADVDGEAESGDQRPAGDVGVFFVTADVGARLLDQLLDHPAAARCCDSRDRRS